MIKPGTVSTAATPAPRSAPPAEAESRPVGRDGENGAFADAMDAQWPRDDTDSCDRHSSVQEGGKPEEPAGGAAGTLVTAELAPTSPTSPTSPTAPTAPTDPALDPMLGLCATPPVEPASGFAGLPDLSRGNAMRAAAPPPEPGAAGGAGDLRAMLDGELQPRLALGGSAVVAVTAGAASATAAASTLDAVHVDGPVGITANAAAGELRTTDRTAAAPAAAASRSPPEMRAPLGSAAWADELGARVTWMVDRGEQVASLRLSPENLGPVEVRIAMREGETSVWFGAAHADTRAAIEQSLPRLREMLGASGLSLADAGVFSHTPRDPQRGFTSAALARAAQESGADPAGGIVMQVSRRGLVDLYA